VVASIPGDVKDFSDDELERIHDDQADEYLRDSTGAQS
jgi:hypothetical protein